MTLTQLEKKLGTRIVAVGDGARFAQIVKGT